MAKEIKVLRKSLVSIYCSNIARNLARFFGGCIAIHRVIALMLTLALPQLSHAQTVDTCEDAPTETSVIVPEVLRNWMSISCGSRGHTLFPSRDYVWLSDDGRSLNFPALGPGGVPAVTVDGAALVIGRGGAYAPLVGGGLMSKHDAFFSKTKFYVMSGELLEVANATVSKEKAFVGPYAEGYILDLLSNQGFGYRLYLFVKDGNLRQIYAQFDMPRKNSLRLPLTVVKR
jgi:hypothetical protein